MSAMRANLATSSFPPLSLNDTKDWPSKDGEDEVRQVRREDEDEDEDTSTSAESMVKSVSIPPIILKLP